jgi:hypothetical protein
MEGTYLFSGRQTMMLGRPTTFSHQTVLCPITKADILAPSGRMIRAKHIRRLTYLGKPSRFLALSNLSWKLIADQKARFLFIAPAGMLSTEKEDDLYEIDHKIYRWFAI